MQAITDIPFEPDAGSLMKTVHVEPNTQDAGEFEDLLKTAAAVGSPKALYRECFIDARGDDTVRINGITFTSRALRMNLDKVERVFPFVATCGTELDQVTLPATDFLKQFWLDAIKAAALATATKHLNEHLARRFRLGKTICMSPGSGDVDVWPIQQQRDLFALAGDVKGLIGVELTESFLMIPNKTVSGIRFPSEVDFRTCQLCHRDNCPGRSAPFDKNLWESVQHE